MVFTPFYNGNKLPSYDSYGDHTKKLEVKFLKVLTEHD